MSFSETWNEITNGVSKNAKGKSIVSHSAIDFNTMSKAMLNDLDYEAEQVKIVDGKVVKDTFKPAVGLRQGMIKSILQKAGHDRSEAEKLATDIKIDNVDGLYEFMSEDIYQYVRAKKKFNFIRKDNFEGSIQLDDIPERDVEYRDMATGEKMVKRDGAYNKLIAKSTCPVNKKGKAKKA